MLSSDNVASGFAIASSATADCPGLASPALAWNCHNVRKPTKRAAIALRPNCLQSTERKRRGQYYSLAHSRYINFYKNISRSSGDCCCGLATVDKNEHNYANKEP